MNEIGDRRSAVGGERPRRRLVGAAVAFVLLGSPIPNLRSQSPGTYAERAVITVAVQSGAAEVARTIVRDGHYAVTRRGDTLVVQAQELSLTSTSGSETIRHDTDGFVGGHWKLLADDHGGWRTVTAPFVPVALEEVADLARLMDDFFPPRPPASLPVGAREAGRDGRTWQRLPGDGAHAVHAWNLTRDTDTTRTVADSLAMTVHEVVEEHGEGSWLADGAASWTRRIVTRSEQVVAGRLIRARLVTEIAVRRLP